MIIGDIKRLIAGFPNAAHVVIAQLENCAPSGKYDIGSIYMDTRGVVVFTAETRASTLAPRRSRWSEVAETAEELIPAQEEEEGEANASE